MSQSNQQPDMSNVSDKREAKSKSTLLTCNFCVVDPSLESAISFS